MVPGYARAENKGNRESMFPKTEKADLKKKKKIQSIRLHKQKTQKNGNKNPEKEIIIIIMKKNKDRRVELITKF